MDRSKSKYENDLAEKLYGEDPDESIGSVYELGWAGRYDDERAIVFEDQQGFVWIEMFLTKVELMVEWGGIEEDYEAWDMGLLV